MCSNRGPALAVADINQDGEDDIFLGGGKNQTNQLLLSGEQNQEITTSMHNKIRSCKSPIF